MKITKAILVVLLCLVAQAISKSAVTSLRKNSRVKTQIVGQAPPLEGSSSKQFTIEEYQDAYKLFGYYRYHDEFQCSKPEVKVHYRLWPDRVLFLVFYQVLNWLKTDIGFSGSKNFENLFMEFIKEKRDVNLAWNYINGECGSRKCVVVCRFERDPSTRNPSIVVAQTSYDPSLPVSFDFDSEDAKSYFTNKYPQPLDAMAVYSAVDYLQKNHI